jgi:hypothetical protein
MYCLAKRIHNTNGGGKREQREGKNRKETGKREEKGKKRRGRSEETEVEGDGVLEHSEMFQCSLMTCLHGAEEDNLHL